MKAESSWWVRALHPIVKRCAPRLFLRWCEFRFHHIERRRPTDGFEPPPLGEIPISNESRRERRPPAGSTAAWREEQMRHKRIEHEKALGLSVQRSLSREAAEQYRKCKVCGERMKLGVEQPCPFRAVSGGKCTPAHLPTCEFKLPSGSCDCGLSQNTFNAYLPVRPDPVVSEGRPWNPSRSSSSAYVFIVGASGLLYETVWRTSERPTMIALFSAVIGLPLLHGKPTDSGGPH